MKYANADVLVDTLIAENGYAYATGYLTSIISSMGYELNLTKRQMKLLEELLEKRTAEIRTQKTLDNTV